MSRERCRVRSCLFVMTNTGREYKVYTATTGLSDSATGEKERLIQDIEQFKASKQRYRSLGVPYHRGYLLYGPQGRERPLWYLHSRRGSGCLSMRSVLQSSMTRLS